LLHFHAADKQCEWLKPTHFPVGILPLDDPGKASTIHMEPGDVLVLLSDGIYEFANEQGAQFGEEGVKQTIVLHHHLPMVELCGQLLQAVFHFAGDAKQADDITMVLLRRLEAA
jgi:phosphoserine phosphatase